MTKPDQNQKWCYKYKDNNLKSKIVRSCITSPKSSTFTSSSTSQSPVLPEPGKKIKTTTDQNFPPVIQAIYSLYTPLIKSKPKSAML